MCRRQLILDGVVDASLRLDRLSPYQWNLPGGQGWPLAENPEIRTGEAADVRQDGRQI
jgi:hypothetical protein